MIENGEIGRIIKRAERLTTHSISFNVFVVPGVNDFDVEQNFNVFLTVL